MTEMAEYLIDRSLYYEGRVGTMRRAIRRYRERPAIAKGETVTIVRLTWTETGCGHLPRTLVRTESGAERWIEATEAEWQGEPLEIRGW